VLKINCQLYPKSTILAHRIKSFFHFEKAFKVLNLFSTLTVPMRHLLVENQTNSKDLFDSIRIDSSSFFAEIQFTFKAIKYNSI